MAGEAGLNPAALAGVAGAGALDPAALAGVAGASGLAGMGGVSPGSGDVAPAKNPALSDRFDADLCQGPRAYCANAAHCFRSPIIGGTFCDDATGVQSCPNAEIGRACSICYPYSECSGPAEALTYTPNNTYIPRTCAMGESASEVASLEPLTYWSNLQQTGPGNASICATASNCNAAGESKDNQSLVIILVAAAAAVVFTLAVAALGLFYTRHRVSISGQKAHAKTATWSSSAQASSTSSQDSPL